MHLNFRSKILFYLKHHAGLANLGKEYWYKPGPEVIVLHWRPVQAIMRTVNRGFRYLGQRRTKLLIVLMSGVISTFLWPESHQSSVICCRSCAHVFVFTQANTLTRTLHAQIVESIFRQNYTHLAQFIHFLSQR